MTNKRQLFILLQSLACLCLVMAIATALNLSLQYFKLLRNAQAYNELESGEAVIYTDKGKAIKPYDYCGGISSISSSSVSDDFSTHWTRVYKFNAVVLTLVSTLFLSFLTCAPCTVYYPSTSSH